MDAPHRHDSLPRKHTAIVDPTGVAASRATTPRCDVVVRAERSIRGPLGAVRLILEGQTGVVDTSVRDRALAELERIEHGLDDLLAWVAPRDERTLECTLAELVYGIRHTLRPDERECCTFEINRGAAPLHCDVRLVADTVTRVVRHALATRRMPDDAVLLHAHSDGEQSTISVVEQHGAADRSGLPHTTPGDSIAEVLMARDLHRIGGRASMHDSSGQRCYVLVLPRRSASPKERGVA